MVLVEVLDAPFDPVGWTTVVMALFRVQPSHAAIQIRLPVLFLKVY